VPVQFTAQFGRVIAELDSTALDQVIEREIVKIMKELPSVRNREDILRGPEKDDVQKSEPLPAILFPDERTNPRLQPPALR
jgi:hypothetical protein